MNSPVSEILPIDIRALAARLPVRHREGHKGDYGHVLVVGGSAGFGGAPGLVALGALRAGAGLVSAAVPASIVNGPIATLAPEAMAHPIAAHRGRLRCNKFLTWLYSMRPFDVIAVGPGLGQNEETAGVVHALLEIENRKLVLDADALNIVAASENGFADVARDVGGGRILTPHPGEAARLLRTDVATINADRPAAVRHINPFADLLVRIPGSSDNGRIVFPGSPVRLRCLQVPVAVGKGLSVYPTPCPGLPGVGASDVIPAHGTAVQEFDNLGLLRRVRNRHKMSASCRAKSLCLRP